jgi:serine/threonine-protein kinase PRP4
MLDMFGEATPVEEEAPANVILMAETCDDPDGYYKATIGELIRNYKITLILGKGVFGSVVRAVNVETEQEVAIKIVRIDQVYRMSGESERNILKYLNDNDPKSNSLNYQ